MREPASIVRTILIRTAGEVLLPETPPGAEPLLIEALLDVLCELLDGDQKA